MLTEQLKTERTDFLVVGTGIAGLYTALHLSKLGDVTLLTKDEVKESCTQYAQGGIAAVLDKGDSWELHMEDTLEAGDDFCDRDAVEVLVKEGPKRVLELIEIGTKFDYVEGELDLSKEGAHSRRRILHARGDATGEEIRESLTAAVKKIDRVDLVERTFLIDMINQSGKVRGTLCKDMKNNNFIKYITNHVILACGGCGRVYKYSTNPRVTTGDGVAVAYRSGADIVDMEFIQFHPTALYNPDGFSFLISETVRGEGGLLRNKDGERFMRDHHKDAELAPRDVVSRAIIEECEKDGKDHVWLDVSHLDEDFLRGRFPKIYKTLKDIGIDMSYELIPVAPSAHYMIGGLKTDLYGKTNVPGLYACGEVASTGVHGANRLASNSLLEGLVFGHRIYRGIKKDGGYEKESKDIDTSEIPDVEGDPSDEGLLGEIKEDMREKMMKNAGIVRKEDDLTDLINWLDSKIREIDDLSIDDQTYWELKNMLTVSRLISRAALLREESRGAHHRSDHPRTLDEWKDLHIVFNIEESKGEVR
ncbi:MAG: L-aspartate oxidase [Candidatus Natronoplasma sp.]